MVHWWNLVDGWKDIEVREVGRNKRIVLSFLTKTLLILPKTCLLVLVLANKRRSSLWSVHAFSILFLRSRVMSGSEGY